MVATTVDGCLAAKILYGGESQPKLQSHPSPFLVLQTNTCPQIRHMEDGCSRRFDIGTLDIQAEGLSGGPSGSRATRAAVKHLSPDPALTAAGANPLSSRAGNSAT